MSEKRWLSKSQIGTFLQCPMKWKYQYIDKRETKGSKAMDRGIQIHSNIEKFYDNIEIKNNVIFPTKELGELGQFMKFEQRRIQSCLDEDGKLQLKYFKPVCQELKLANSELKLRGFVDAVYINPKDDGVIIIDWKTGKYRPYNLSKYRFELAVYAELLKKQKGIEAKYWGIYFVDADKVFFEPIKPISIKAMYKSVDKVRKEMESGEYKCKPGVLCKWCDFNSECEAWK